MLRTLSLIAALGMLSLSATAAEAPKAEDKPDKPRIQVFRLKVADPADVLAAFNALTGQPGPRVETLPHPSATLLPPVPAQPVAPAPQFNFRVEHIAFQQDPLPLPPPPPVVTPPPTPLPIAPAQPPAPICRAMADPRTRSLIVHGKEKERQFAADLVAILDTPEEKAIPEVKSLKAFRLKHLDVNDFVGILQTLDAHPGPRVVPVGRMKILLAVGSEEQYKELAEAIKELDIPAKGQ
jgi:hypothetical protein